jgi:hypothetical protein
MKLRGSLVRGHANTTARSVGPFEAVRLEVVSRTALTATHLPGTYGVLVLETHIGPFAAYCLFHVHLLFFRHSGPILYPLDKSVG